MLVEKSNSQQNQRRFAEYRSVNKEIIPWFEKVIHENNCKIERKEWKSKYNSYVVYDYEPFCAEGFEINYTISSTSVYHLNFVRYLYENKINTIDYLNSCILD